MNRITFLFITLFFLLNCSCSNKSLVEINKGGLQVFIEKNDIQPDVVKVIVYLTRQGFETQKQSMNLLNDKNANISIENIEVGSWHLVIHALNHSDRILFLGETDISVQLNTVTPVNLQLHPPKKGSIDLQ